MGPGDPELVTIKGLRALREADEVFVPVGDTGEVGRAEATVREYLDEGRIRRLLFALSDDAEARERNWTGAGREVSEHLREGKTCAFATIGDPNVYSTFTYLARKVRETLPEVEVETVPGITAMQDLASRSGTVLLEGDERLALLPFTAGEEHLREALASFETVVCYKGGNRTREVLGVAEEAGRLGDAVYGARLGIADEEILPAADMAGREGTYLSTVIFGRRAWSGGLGRGTIRLARSGDAAAVARCVRSAYSKYVKRLGKEPAPMREDYASAIQAGEVYVLAVGDALVGTITMRLEGDHLFVGSLAVSPSAQGRGLGRKLMKFAESETAAANLPEIRLYTNEKMSENLAFYERLGFEETHRKLDEGYRRVFLRKPMDAGAKGGDGGSMHHGR